MGEFPEERQRSVVSMVNRGVSIEYLHDSERVFVRDEWAAGDRGGDISGCFGGVGCEPRVGTSVIQDQHLTGRQDPTRNPGNSITDARAAGAGSEHRSGPLPTRARPGRVLSTAGPSFEAVDRLPLGVDALRRDGGRCGHR